MINKADKVSQIIKLLDVPCDTNDMSFMVQIMNSGKTDNTERASMICGYFEKEGNEMAVYEILNTY